jgi:hypothetical protein
MKYSIKQLPDKLWAVVDEKGVVKWLLVTRQEALVKLHDCRVL